jgi:NADH:ubiquinone oxidoreductase subunit E
VSRNLIELLKRTGANGGTRTALAVLREAVDERGAVSDDDRRLAAQVSGLPEAAVYGVSSYYDDLRQPRGRRHVRVCTGTACWAADFDDHVDLEAGIGVSMGERSADGELSLGETVCLGFCHASPSFRDGDVIDAGPGALGRVLAGTPEPAREPAWRSVLDDPVLTRPGDWSGLRHALAALSPEQLRDEVKAANLRGRGGAGFPAGSSGSSRRRTPRRRSSSSSTATRATRAPTSTST